MSPPGGPPRPAWTHDRARIAGRATVAAASAPRRRGVRGSRCQRPPSHEEGRRLPEFVLGLERQVKEFGLSLASAVFFDVFVVRSPLLPAVLQRPGAPRGRRGGARTPAAPAGDRAEPGPSRSPARPGDDASLLARWSCSAIAWLRYWDTAMRECCNTRQAVAPQGRITVIPTGEVSVIATSAWGACSSSIRDETSCPGRSRPAWTSPSISG